MDNYANAVTLQIGSQITGGLNIGNSSSATLTLTDNGTGGTQAYSAAVAGGTTFNGSLTKAGVGTCVLDQSMTCGGTTITAGTLQLGDGTAGHDGSLATSGITGNASLVYNLNGNQTARYVISGSGTLTKGGPGTLTPTAQNAFTGGSTVNAGTLTLGDGTHGATLVGLRPKSIASPWVCRTLGNAVGCEQHVPNSRPVSLRHRGDGSRTNGMALAESPIERNLILLPGLDGEGFSLRKLVGELPTSVRPTVITYPRDRATGYEGLVAFVTPLLPAGPFVLLGDSFSSPLAIMLAARRPAGLRGLILTSGFARNPLWSSPTWLAPVAAPLAGRLYEPYVRTKVWWRGHGPVGEARRASLAGLQPAVMGSRVHAVLRVNVLPQLAACPVPVLYVRGSRDRLVVERNLREMQQRLPSMRVAEFDGGHCVLKSRAPQAAAAICDFVEACHTAADHPAAVA
jgi:autotransporter-associated beta strand protein